MATDIARFDPRFHAQKHPHKVAYVMASSGESISYGQLSVAINRTAHLFRSRGLRPGDCVALFMENHLRYLEICWAALYSGLYITLLDSHLGAQAIEHILEDSDAVLLITSASKREIVEQVAGVERLRGRLMVDGSAPSFEALDDALALMPTDPIPDEVGGMYMLYTSGTTGRPKGVRRALPSSPADTLPVRYGRYFERLFGYDSSTVQLIPSHLYHIANINAAVVAAAVGGTAVIMERFHPKEALELIERHQVTHGQWVPWHFSALLMFDDRDAYDVRSLQAALHTAAPCSVDVKEKMIGWWGPILHDDYGMSEGFGGCSITSAEWLEHPGSVGKAYIGELHIVDDSGAELPPLGVGVVYFESDRQFEYYKDPARTRAARDSRGWATVGDVGYVDEEGYLYIVDRQDDMINVGGNKVYPQEVEDVLATHPGVRDVGVVGVPSALLGEEVRAFVCPRPEVEADAELAGALMRLCRARLVGFKCPSSVTFVAELPRTPIGKLQRRRLRGPEMETSELYRDAAGLPAGGLRSELERAPVRERYSLLAEHLRSTLTAALGIDGSASIAPDRGFIELGLDSITSIEVRGRLAADLGADLPAMLLFNHPTLERLADFLLEEVFGAGAQSGSEGSSHGEAPTAAAERHRGPNGGPSGGPSASPRGQSPQMEPVAIIGMSCRFPGAPSLEAFWRLLMEKGDAITEVPADRWDIDAYYDEDPDAPGKTYTRYGGFLEDVDQFDASFFSVSPREAMTLDPQQRFALEVGWEALEDAAIAPTSLYGTPVGVFIGVTWADYYELCVYGQQGTLGRNEYVTHLGFGGSTSLVPGRLSYFYGLTGPCMTLGTACSSSLVAIHYACQSLRLGECNLALAGGSQLNLTPDIHIAFTKSRMLSPDGRCKSFDASANGYARSEGCALIALKRLADAVADGDNIVAVIRGSAVNNDGRSSGLVVPNGPAQEAVVRQALRNAGVEPSQVSYVEAHGTGTPVGDPIEVGALGAVYNRGRAQPLLIGSVKTNIGHTECAAGVAGVMKTAMALQRGVIPANLHFKSVNPHINCDELNVSVVSEHTPWPSADRRLAGVSAFGISGTNAHLILEAWPGSAHDQPSGSHGASSASPQEAPPGARLWPERPLHLLTLSAKTPEAMTALLAGYRSHLEDDDGLPLADVCYTANTGRAQLACRRAFVADSSAALMKQLERAAGEPDGPALRASQAAPRLAFLFSGQGTQHVDMGRELYETQPVFRDAVERCAASLERHMERPLLDVLYPPAPSAAPDELHQTALTQPALFTLEYALAELWRSWGVEPGVVLGHSLGELVAACVAGVFDVEDGLKLVAARGRLMQACPGGGRMVVVGAPEDLVTEYIGQRREAVSIAALNGPENTVISGDASAVMAVESALQAAGLTTKVLNVSHAFHSPQMEPMLAEFERIAQEVSYSPPKISMISNVTGTAAGDEVATPAYWVRHVREPVRFYDGMISLGEWGCDAFIELGPKPTLLGMGRHCLPRVDVPWLPSLRPQKGDWQQLLESLARLYCCGVDVDWGGFDAPYHRRKVALPTYPFQRRRYWVTDLYDGSASDATVEVAGSAPITAAPVDRPQIDVAALMADQGALFAYLKEQTTQVTGLNPDDALSASQSWLELGLDSLMTLELSDRIRHDLNVEVPLDAILGGASIQDVLSLIQQRLNSDAAGD